MKALLVWAAFAAQATLLPVAAAQEGARTITARDLATLRDMSGLNISPDGRWVAFSVTQADPAHNRYGISWHALEIATGRAHRVADGGELLPAHLQSTTVGYSSPDESVWAPDSLSIAYLRRENQRTQVWRTGRDGRGAQQLTHNKADVRGLIYARDGRRILFQTEPSAAQLAQDMAAEGQTGFLYDERFLPMYSFLPVGPRDMDSHERYATSEISARQIWVYELATGAEQRANEAEQAEYAALTEATPRAWTEKRDPERQGWRAPQTIVAQFSGGSDPIVCTAPQCTGSEIRGPWWRSNDEVLFMRHEGFREQDRALYAWRPNEAASPRLVVRTPNFLTGCVVAQDKLFCFYEEPNYPRRLAAVDLDNGAIKILHDPNPDFAWFNLGVPPQRVAIRAKSGVETYGYLVLPPQHRRVERLPLVIVTYRCFGFLRGGVGDEYPIFPFAAQGFAVLCFDAPEDLEQQARLDLTAYSNWWRGPGNPARQRVEDALDAALDQLDRTGLIDPDRVAVTGLSFGAEIVGFALPHLPRLAAAIASQHPGPGPSQYPYQGRTSRALYRGFGLGSPNETPERWREFSFSPHIENVRAPLLLNVADREFLATLDAVTALEDAGSGVEMYVFPDETHWKWQSAHRLTIYNRNSDWLNFWLRGVEDGDSVKAEQYKRWRAMRLKQCERLKGEGAPWYCRQDRNQSTSQ